MSKGKLLFSLEGLEDGINDEVTQSVDNLDAAMLAVMEDEFDYIEAEDDIAKADMSLEEIEVSVKRLKGIRDSIDKYGISAGMMIAVDPDGELPAAGICCAYEELGDVPVKDANATAAVEGIDGALVKLASSSLSSPAVAATWKIVGLPPWGYAAVVGVAIVGTLVVKLAPIIIKSVKSHNTALLAAQKNLESATPDEESFGKMEVKSYSKNDFQAMAKAGKHVLSVIGSGSLSKVAADLESLMNGSSLSVDKVTEISKKAGAVLMGIHGDNAVETGLGLKVAVTDKGLEVSSVKPTMLPTSGTLTSLNWKASDAKEAVKAALEITKEAAGLEKELEGTIKVCKGVVDTLKKKVGKDAEVSEDDKKAYKKATADIKDILSANKDLIRASISFMYRINGAALRIAKAAIKAKAKAE